MNISTLNEIKNDSVVLYYELPDCLGPNLWVGTEEKANEYGELIHSTFHGQEGFHIFRGSFTNQEKAYHYLALVEDESGIRMYDGTWDEVLNFFKEDINQNAFMRTTIPLFKLEKTKEEEVINMTQTAKKVLTGADVVTTAKSGELFATVSEPVVVIKRNEDGVLIYNDSKEGIIIDNKFLTETFVPHKEEKLPEREYISLAQAVKAFADDEHIHADVFLPDGTVHESVCLNQFLPIAQAIQEVQEEDGPLGVMKFMAEFQQATRKGDEDALEMLNPIHARIPVEILAHGKFFIEAEEDSPSFE